MPRFCGDGIMRSFRFLLRTGERLLDFILNFFAICMGYIAVSIRTWEFHLNAGTLFFATSFFCMLAIFLYGFHNVYYPMRTKRVPYYLGRIFLVNLEMTAMAIVVILWLHPGDYPNFIRWTVVSATLSLLILTIKKGSMMLVLRNIRSNRKNIKYILMVTDSQEMADSYMEEIHRNPQYGYCMIGYVGNLNVVGLPHLGTTADLDRILKEYRPDEVVMALDTVRKKVIAKYISICDDNCCKVLLVPSVCGYLKAQRQVSMLGNLPMIDIRSNPLDLLSNQILKRTTDIVLSLILLILTSPLMLFTAIGVKLSSPGPVFFKQVRVGKNNRQFTIYKFRSMRENQSEKNGWSNENDDRKTKFGAFIRKFALDELPQFYNVLIGDMSLVGPRPEVPFYVEKFKKEVPLYMLKHSLRPGITGLAQIKGLRGDTSIQARIEEDINYIENWTFWGDIRILLLTPFHAVNRQEKYVEREEKEAAFRREMDNRTYVRGVSLQGDGHPEENSDPAVELRQEENVYE